MSIKSERFKRLQELAGDRAAEQLAAAELYMETLESVFERDPGRDFCRLILDTHWTAFNRLSDLHALMADIDDSWARKMWLMDVLYVVRHTWEFTYGDGITLTGDDLHKEWPLMFEDADCVEDLGNILSVIA